MVEVPKSILVNTGEQGRVGPLIDQFLREVYETVVKEHHVPEHRHLTSPLSDFEIRVCGMFKPRPDSCLVPSDDMLHMLLYQERVVAAVIETRTESNRVRYDFFMYETLDEAYPEPPEEPNRDEEILDM